MKLRQQCIAVDMTSYITISKAYGVEVGGRGREGAEWGDQGDLSTAINKSCMQMEE